MSLRLRFRVCSGIAGAFVVAFAAHAGLAQAASTDCRASAARASAPGQVDSEPTVANPSGSPCVTEAQQAAGVQPVGGMSVTNPRALTRNTAGVLAASASVDSASIGNTALGVLQTVTVGHVSATQQQSCSAGASTGSGSSSVDALVVAGIPVSVVDGQVIDQTIAGIRVRTNQVNGTSRQALIVDIGATEYVLGDVRASGDACASLTSDSPGDHICPVGATYDVTSNLCVIEGAASSGTTRTIVGPPFAGPSGGTVISLAEAQDRARDGKLPHSHCLQGPGPKYVVVGTKGNDHITGTNGADRILGLGGNDRIDGGRSNDCVDGNTGSDTLTGGEGNDRVYGNAGNDHLNGGPGTDVLSGGSGNDTINTAFGRDCVTGGSGNDAINAATAGRPATINAGTGRDKVRINRNERKHTRHAETVHVIR